MSKKPTVLMILDGYGIGEAGEYNAISKAKKPVMDGLMEKYPYVLGNASGLSVGLPDGQMGNSEVGHLNMGAGRIVYQDLTRITKSIEDGDFFTNEALLMAMNNAKEEGKSLHLYGLLCDGGVHSHITHLYAILKMAKNEGVKNVFIHGFMDGRDTAPKSGIGYMKELLDKIEEIGVGEVASISGRYYAMDRDNRWERVEKAYRALVFGEGIEEKDPIQAIENSYNNDITDEFIVPTVIVNENNEAIGKIKAGDSIIFYNFRPDRAREITRVFCDDEFVGFDRGERVKTTYVCFTNYDITISNKIVAFEKVSINNTFGEFLARNNMTQARIAETEKYAHVTFFFNGGVEEANEGEERILVKSPKVATYDLQPEMSAFEVCDKVVDAINSGKYDVIITNFANPDMVGHTGVMEAAIKAIEVVDECVGKIVDSVCENDGVLFICADHGNADKLVDEDGKPFTSHTTNKVPFILVNAKEEYTLKEDGALCDIIPTLIELMGMEQPEEMTGKSLLEKNN